MKMKSYSFVLGFILLSWLSYGQIDSLEYRNIYTWKINPLDLSLEYAETDTLLEGFQRYNPLLENTITATYLGNLGSPAKSNIYSDRMINNTGFLFSEPYRIYFHHPNQQLYYNTKKRYTLLNYSNAGPKNESEQLLGVLHTQNVTENFNVGIDYDMISSDGRYQEQQVRQNVVKLFSSFHAQRYRAHLDFYLNRNKSQLNGGIDSLNYLGSEEYSNRQNIPVRLSNARNQNLSSGLYLVHEYKLGKSVPLETEPSDSSNLLNPGKLASTNDTLGIKNDTSQVTGSANNPAVLMRQKKTDPENSEDSTGKAKNEQQEMVFKYSGFSVSHEIYYNSDVRKFFDDDLTEPFYSGLDRFIDSTKTHDEVRQMRFANSLSLHYRYKNYFSSRLALYNERMQYQYNIIPDTTFTDTLNSPARDTIVSTNHESTESNNRISLFLKTSLFNDVYFEGYADYYFSGYKKNNVTTNIKFSYPVKDFKIGFEGNYSNLRPGYFITSFSSNHFKWNNNNLKKIEDVNLGLIVQSEKHRLRANVQIGQIRNHVYFDTSASVNQHMESIGILSAAISKKFTLGPIHSSTRFVYQKTTNNSIIALPELNLYQSLYYEKLLHFKSTGGNLLVQIGLDYRYASSFYADSYMPTTGLFYRQFDHKMKDFHRLDLFANFTLKRARFYIQYSYLNSLINESYYFNAPFYPAPEPVFKYGVAWSFYD
ncbi:MAG: putative porin [Bacteroidales bacterium]|nr:putative porin [Bacteroidales bacterium]